MTLQVLQNKQQIRKARDTLEARGLSSLPGSLKKAFARVAPRLGLSQPLMLGDFIKSWDLLASIEFLEANVRHDSAILDIGAFSSEILVALRKAGFTNLTGVDLNPRLKDMPFQGDIRYVTSDFMNTPFNEASFEAITSISVIEHGFDPKRLLTESSRILRTGGYFIASFDYWPNKIDTGTTRFFDMDWLIFSRDDVAKFISEAANHGLEPVGELHYDVAERAIEHGGYEYSFGWLVLRKIR